MSGNNMWCKQCKSHHHAAEVCGNDAKKLFLKIVHHQRILAWNAALSEAAKLVERYGEEDCGRYSHKAIADDIRNLKRRNK